ncbi:MAG: hypothetical protein NVS2B16_11210 [Chloroflexota bacterium]
MDENTVYAEDPYVDASDSYPPREHGAENVARRAVLAGIGAIALACDTAGDTFDRFVNRGERVESELRERVDDVRQHNAGARGRVDQYYRTALDALLDRANLPSKGDLDTINVKLNIVSRKLDDLQMQNVTGGTAVPAPPASTPASPTPVDEETT